MRYPGGVCKHGVVNTVNGHAVKHSRDPPCLHDAAANRRTRLIEALQALGSFSEGRHTGLHDMIGPTLPRSLGDAKLLD